MPFADRPRPRRFNLPPRKSHGTVVEQCRAENTAFLVLPDQTLFHRFAILFAQRTAAASPPTHLLTVSLHRLLERTRVAPLSRSRSAAKVTLAGHSNPQNPTFYDTFAKTLSPRNRPEKPRHRESHRNQTLTRKKIPRPQTLDPRLPTPLPPAPPPTAYCLPVLHTGSCVLSAALSNQRVSVIFCCV